MRRELTVAVLVLVGLAVLAGVGAAQDAEVCDFPYETEGAFGTTVVEEEPERVVTLAPSVTQVVWELEAQDKVVGVSNTQFVQYLEGIDEFPDVGSAFDPSFPERVVAQNPDHVIGALLTPDQANALENAGLQFFSFPPRKGFDGIARKVEEVGRQLGKCDKADEVVGEFRRDVDRVETAVEGEPRPTVLYRIPQQGAFVPGKGTFINDIIATAGGENAYAEEGLEGFVRIPSDETEAEIVLEQDPDWIVLLDTDDPVPENDLYNGTTAVQEDQILTVDANLIQQAAPRVTTPLERMARAFHPDEFKEDDGDGTSRRRLGGDEGEEPPQGTEAVVSSITVADGVSLAEFRTGPVRAVELSVETEGEVTVSTVEVGDAPGLPLQRVTIDVPDVARDAPGTVRMSVERGLLENASVPTDALVVVRKEADGGWSALDTTTFETDDGVTLVAEAPGFSDFAVVASTEPTPVVDVSVTNADTGTVALDASASSDEYGEVVGYSWAVGDETYEGETVEVTAEDGDEVRLTVTNDAGLSATATETVEFADEEETDESGERVSGEDEEQSSAESDEGGEDGTNASEEDTTTPEGDEDEGEDEGGGEGLPGFTAVAALVALIAVLALVEARSRRR